MNHVGFMEVDEPVWFIEVMSSPVDPSAGLVFQQSAHGVVSGQVIRFRMEPDLLISAVAESIWQ